MPDPTHPIGRITRCSTESFTGAVRPSALALPAFGAFCQAQDQSDQVQVIGVIYDIRIEDDPLARQMAALEELPAEQLADAQQNRQAPIEFSALTAYAHFDVDESFRSAGWVLKEFHRLCV